MDTVYFLKEKSMRVVVIAILTIIIFSNFSNVQSQEPITIHSFSSRIPDIDPKGDIGCFRGEFIKERIKKGCWEITYNLGDSSEENYAGTWIKFSEMIPISHKTIALKAKSTYETSFKLELWRGEEQIFFSRIEISSLQEFSSVKVKLPNRIINKMISKIVLTWEAKFEGEPAPSTEGKVIIDEIVFE